MSLTGKSQWGTLGAMMCQSTLANWYGASIVREVVQSMWESSVISAHFAVHLKLL